ncbi:MAG TPA: AAA family ATPase [Patescibacteria group bacterium]|nr:AAA family ATPase [Patescibacteria group bacterium]
MKVIFLYGPPSVGKLTIAKILQQKTGYKLLHNHLLQNPISEVFSFDSPANPRLVREFRLRIVEAASENDLDLILTFGTAGNDHFGHIADVIRVAQAKGGQVFLVQLTADSQTLLHRVESQSRRDHGKNLSRASLKELLDKNPDMLEKYPKREHVTIDTSQILPEEAAEKILQYYHVS